MITDYPYGVYVPGIGPLHPKIAIIGEAPSDREVEALTPFVGPSGGFLDECLKQVGISRNDCWITNVCKYMVPPSPKGKPIPFKVRAGQVGIDIDQCINELRVELQQLNPNVIICLGATALWAVTSKKSIQQYRGSILHGMGFKVVATYHPAHILHQEGEVSGYWQKQVMLFDLSRAKAQSAFPELKLPYRSLNVCESLIQLIDFRERYKNYTKPAIDIEAIGCIPACIGISYAKHEGITVPLWNVNGISDFSDAELASIWVHVADLLSSSEVVGQNFGYDRDKIKRLGFTVKRLASDTMLKAFTLRPELPKNLGFNTSIYTEEPYYKDEGMYEGSTKDLFIGCARDSCVTKEIDEVMDGEIDEQGLRPYYENFILPLHSLYHFREDNTAIEQIGFKVDESIRRNLIEKYIEWDEKIRYQLFQISGSYINTGSPLQVSKLIYDEWKLPQRSGVGEETLTALINSPQVKSDLYKEGMNLILEDRRVKKTTDSYLYAPTDFDGRMRTSFFVCLETGRSSTQKQAPPIRPDIEFKGIEDGKRVSKKQDRGLAFQTITKHGDIGPEVRRMLVPDDGHVFLQADSAQAEARVIFLLAEDYDALEAIDKQDFHALTASWFVGGTEDDWSKKKLGYEHPNRFLGKTLRHAGHLGASARRAMIETNTQARKFKIPVNISEAFAKKGLAIFHAKQPRIKGVFQAGIVSALQRDKRRLVAPVPYGIDAPKGGVRQFYERWGEDLFRQAFSYLPQRIVSENTKAAALRIRGNPDREICGRAEWIKILCESHDALLAQVPIEREKEAAQILKEELERPIDFRNCSLSRGILIIPCEIEHGFNYYDLKKFRFLDEAA